MKFYFYFRDPKESHKEKNELAAEAKSIYVRNLAEDMTDNMLKEVFEKYGPIYYLPEKFRTSAIGKFEGSVSASHASSSLWDKFEICPAKIEVKLNKCKQIPTIQNKCYLSDLPSPLLYICILTIAYPVSHVVQLFPNCCYLYDRPPPPILCICIFTVAYLFWSIKGLYIAKKTYCITLFQTHTCHQY